eukprot:764838-Hanusia_phi.AAC.4
MSCARGTAGPIERELSFYEPGCKYRVNLHEVVEREIPRGRDELEFFLADGVVPARKRRIHSQAGGSRAAVRARGDRSVVKVCTDFYNNGSHAGVEGDSSTQLALVDADQIVLLVARLALFTGRVHGDAPAQGAEVHLERPSSLEDAEEVGGQSLDSEDGHNIAGPALGLLNVPEHHLLQPAPVQLGEKASAGGGEDCRRFTFSATLASSWMRSGRVGRKRILVRAKSIPLILLRESLLKFASENTTSMEF